MEQPISVSTLNDFIFCPASIYFHQMYEDLTTSLFQTKFQLEGTAAHEPVDAGRYSTRKNILQGLSVFCEQYNLLGKIDVFDTTAGFLIERKKKITTVYDGYVFQLYGQCFSLREMGYTVQRIRLHSLDDNRNFDIPLPENDAVMLAKFESTIKQINQFDMSNFMPTNAAKCRNCIYSPFCDRTLD